MVLDELNVLLGIGVQPRLELCVGQRRSLPGHTVGAACARVLKVMQVSLNVEAEGTAVAADAGDALADANVGNGVVDLVGATARKPVLDIGVPVAKDDGGKTGDGVGGVGDAVLGAGLGGDKLGEVVVTDTGRTVRVEGDGDRLLGAEVGGADGSNSGAKGVAGSDDGVVGVGGASLLDGGDGRGADLAPGVVEAGVNLAVGCQVGAASEGEENVRDPVADAAAC